MRNLFLMVGIVLLAAGSLLTLTACEPDPGVVPNQQGQTSIGQALMSTGTPWGVLTGMVVNAVASVFIAKGTSKSAVQKKDQEPYTADDGHAMAMVLQSLGYVVTRSTSPPTIPPPV